jgi:hypothetical protein
MFRTEELDALIRSQQDDMALDRRGKLRKKGRRGKSVSGTVTLDGARFINGTESRYDFGYYDTRKTKWNQIPWIDETFEAARPSLEDWLDALRRLERIGRPEFPDSRVTIDDIDELAAGFSLKRSFNRRTIKRRHGSRPIVNRGRR